MPNPGLTDPPTPIDPATALSYALDRLNACCWTADDRRALREARVACARLRELEGIHRGFSDQLQHFLSAGLALPLDDVAQRDATHDA